MNLTEIPEIPGLMRLQNPEVAEGHSFSRPYTLFDVAEVHLKMISALAGAVTDDFWIVGMSMGGMIASVLGSHLRSRLPLNVRFAFLVTSANLPENPTVPQNLLKEWMQISDSTPDSFEKILAPFFSPYFRSNHPEVCQQYYKYRAEGRNQQSKRAFFRQLTALTSFPGQQTFSNLNPKECHFIGGGSDRILGPSHNENLRGLIPDAVHIEVPHLGHMVNLEQGALFDPRTDLKLIQRP